MVVFGRGDLIWLEFDPSAGHEQSGRRPAFVISPAEYNRRAGLVIAAPITSHVKGYPFEVKVVAMSGPISGVVLVDHIKSLDPVARRAERAGRAAPSCIAEVLARLRPLLA